MESQDSCSPYASPQVCGDDVVEVCTVEIRGVEEEKEDRQRTLAVVRLLCFLCLVILVTLTQEGYMIYTQIQIQTIAGYQVFPQVLYYAVPTIVPLPILIAVTVIGFHGCCCNKNPNLRSHIKNLYILIFAFGLMHTIQVGLYLFVNAILHIDIVPRDIKCMASNHNESDLTYHCYVPKEDHHILYIRNITTNHGIIVLQDALNGSANPTTLTTPEPMMSDPVEIVQTLLERSKAIPNQYQQLTFELKKMIILLQTSIIVALLRFPLWVMFNNLQVHLDLREKQNKASRRDPYRVADIGPDRSPDDDPEQNDKSVRLTITSRFSVKSSSARQSMGSDERYSVAFHDVVATVMRNLRLEQNREHKQWLLRSESVATKWKGYMYAVELCYYCFVEMVDAFSLLDNLAENVDYFTDHRPLFYSTLLFVSLSLMVGTAANFLASHPFRSRKINRLGKSFVVLSNNVPLFVLRCYMAYLFNSMENHRWGSVFLLFTMKELVILILAVIEIIIYCKTPEGVE